MLLPEQSRSRFPYLVSVTVQCSLVLLLAIPWTVQSLRSPSIQIPTILTFQNMKPVVTMKPGHSENIAPSSLPTLPRQARIFTFIHQASNTSTSAVVDAPEIGVAPGGTINGIPIPILPLSVDVAHLAPVPTPPAPNVTEPRRPLEVGGVVQAAKLIHRVQPVYSTLARQVRVQGVVVLEAIIAADGKIQQLHVFSGHPMLIPNAVEAVQQWVYSPTFLNGKAVEVKTTIEVRFTLSER